MDTDSLLDRYWGHQDHDLYGGHVAGRTFDGFPILGEVGSMPLLRQDEAENIVHYNIFKHRFFCLWDEKDSAEYAKVMEHVFNGEFSIKKRIDFPVPDSPDKEPGGSLKIYLEWVQTTGRLGKGQGAFAAPNVGVNIPLNS